MINGDRLSNDPADFGAAFTIDEKRMLGALAAADQAYARRRAIRVARRIVEWIFAGVLIGALVMYLASCAAMSPAPAVHPSQTPYPSVTR
jgi:hypothetical protein